MVCSFFISKMKGVGKIATTGIWKIEKRLDNVIDYTTNIEKTINSDYGKDSYYDLHNVIDYVEADYKTEKQFYVSGVNCNPKTALEEMTITKEQYGKTGGILGFHAFQSFAEGEVTPEQCHAIGVRLAEEMWGDRFEVVVSTHLNTNHYHNHFVINSVSFKDGKRYYDKRETYAELRRVSDSLCEEYGLSVLKEKPCRNSRINFANYQKDNNNKVNYYSIAKNDLDRAIGMATSYYDFEDLMITCSIGAAYSPNNGHEYEELFKKADYCLYVAKEKGRDRYVFFRDDLHKESYENSLNTKDKNVNDGREMKELRFLSGIMEEFAQDRIKAVDELLHHMYDSFKLDSINLYWGPNLNRAYYIGVELGGPMTADYVNTEEFRKLLGGKNHVAVGFVGRQTDIAPEFGMAMREKRVFSTVHCIVGTQNNIKGMFTIDRCKESSQWAEYEIEMAVVAASLINIIAESENN